MGTKSNGLADALFLKVQQKVLGLLFVYSDRSFIRMKSYRSPWKAVSTSHTTHRMPSRSLYYAGMVTDQKIGPEVWRVLALCHQRRNLAEYEGHLEIDMQLLAELIAAANLLQKKVRLLAPI